jgi:hypothetical protein
VDFSEESALCPLFLAGKFMNKSIADASVLYNGDFFRVITMSRGMLLYADPDMPTRLLLPAASDIELGFEVRRALSGSKRISASDFQALLKSGVVQKNKKEIESVLMSQFSYKSRRDMFLKTNKGVRTLSLASHCHKTTPCSESSSTRQA